MEDLDMGMYRNTARGQVRTPVFAVRTRISTLFMIPGDIRHSF